MLYALLFVAVSSITSDTPRLFKRMTFNEAGHMIPAAHQQAIRRKLDQLTEQLAALHPRPANAVITVNGCILEEGTYPHNGSETSRTPYIADLIFWYHNITGWKQQEPLFYGDDSPVYMRIQCNRIGYILEPALGCKAIFIAPTKNEDIKGYPKYNQVIVMMTPGRGLPWRACTRQEYMEDLVKSSERTSTRPMRQRAAAYLQSMSAADKNKPALLKSVKNSPQHFTFSEWSGFAEASDASATALVCVNEQYYDASLPKSSIQLVAISRNYVSHGRALYVSKAQYLEQFKRVNKLLYTPGALQAIHNLMEQ